MTTAVEATKSVESTLNFYLEPALGGHTSYKPGTAGYFRRRFDEHVVNINDIRGDEEKYTLSSHGFQYHRHDSVEKVFDNEERIKSLVYQETEQLLKDVTGASSVFAFSHIVRRASREKIQISVDSDPRLKEDNASIPDVTPAQFIHVDFSNDGAQRVLKDNCPADLRNQSNKSRWAIINVWRPIKPIAKDPLALCSSKSVRDDDLMPISAVLPEKGSGQYADSISKADAIELYYLKYNPEQQWYYIDSMHPQEVILLKCYDSIQDGHTARRVPHSAFTNPKTKHDENRESIEVRCFVFWED